MVGMWKDVDMGIGDAWYVPLSEDYRLLFIDIPEQAFIEHKDSTVLDNVSHVFQSEDKVYCETWDSEYYMLNTTDGSLRKFDEVLEFRNAVPNNNKPLTDVNSFYYERRDAIAGIWFIIAAVLSAGASVWVVYTLHRLIIGKATATS